MLGKHFTKPTLVCFVAIFKSTTTMFLLYADIFVHMKVRENSTSDMMAIACPYGILVLSMSK